MLAPFWTLPTAFLSGAAAAGGIALINSVGNLGGGVATYVFGEVAKATKSYTGGMVFLAVALIVGGCLVLCARHDPALEKHEAAPAKEEEGAAITS
jgi:nitrate/nitrite transporter NarK